ncbi:DUF2207 domain-containing protein [Bowmanella yangjiangensis]|uniref:DUF2207 domain-containing protein n=1 Tax=Bowmanella yangjiangensis TaxID=2811230 RepID=A0ABS3CNN6_9ALTE|nr:DUF2207 domain-containing protein [Bowmanella yangjiangensis]MBN7818705.1 DUF2207 domain-containing protein [Bowmanella yangjiangensis]
MGKLIISILFCLYFLSNSISANENADGISQEIINEKLPDDYQELASLRKRISLHIDDLAKEIKRIESEKEYLPINKEDAERKIDYYELKIKSEANVLEKLKAKENKSKEEIEEMNSIENYHPQLLSELKKAKEEKERLTKLQSDLSDINKKISQSRNNLDKVDVKMSNLINTESERNEFRKLISFTYCGLVAIVIVGFYFIALKIPKIAESIFSGEKGIQFVAIFLIVIAIILFGIMGILESKELSALLGGLSGYILGRVSMDKETS